MSKLWFSLYDKEIYSSNEDSFVKLNTIDAYQNLELNYTLVHKELKKLFIEIQI